MRCSSCGAEIPNGVKFCPACGAAQPEAPVAPPPPPPPPPPPQYSYQAPAAAAPVPAPAKVKATGQIVFSIINILCCYGSLFGIIALIFAIMANSAKTTEEALSKRKTAKILNIIGIIIAVVGLIISLIAGLLPLIASIAAGDFSGFDWSSTY